MVKRQKEKQYQSAREQRQYSQIRSGSAAAAGTHGIQRRLPFSHCSLTLTAFEQPVCNAAGIVFENSAILPFLMKHKIDPVSGKPMTSRDLITLHMDKDEEGRWQCPVLTKAFSDHTKIVAVIQRPEGNEANVYSYDAYYELNVKAKNYEDLTTGKRFDKTKDVIILSDPTDDELNKRRDINTFYHVKHGRELEQSKNSGQVQHSMTATRIMEQLQKKKSEEEKANSKKRPAESISSDTNSLVVDGKRIKVLAEDVLGVKYTTGKTGGSLTSTSMDVSYHNQAREATEEEIMQARFRVMRKLKKKGYVRLRTSMGDLTIELHCDIAPRTCTNFLGLCAAGKYDGTLFHRLIANFMIQGGKAKDGATDESIWGDAFTDEFDDRLKHTGAGILSMANSGTNTNRQQFFITFKSCNHLDRKHSVFGTVIDGTGILAELEQAPADKKERPTEPIKIIATEIVVNPAKEAAAMETQRLQEIAESRHIKEGRRKGVPAAPKAAAPKVSSSVGRYLKQKPNSTAKEGTSDDPANTATTKSDAAPSRLSPPPKKTSFGNFSGW